MASYRPDPALLTLGPDFYDAVEPAKFPQCTPRFLNRRWAERVGLELSDGQWAAHFCRFEPLPRNLPEPLAQRMIQLAQLATGDWLLEPSAGLGRLIRPLFTLDVRLAGILAVEIDRDRADRLALLVQDRAGVICGDFLGYAAEPAALGTAYDAVLMNPPFADSQDIAHIRAAWSLLRPGGRIVAIASAHSFISSNTKSRLFRDWLSSIGAEIEELPAGTFKESGTMVAARLITATKTTH